MPTSKSTSKPEETSELIHGELIEGELVTITPEVKVVEATSSGMNNFPYSVEQAARELQKYLEAQLQNGWKYHGTLSRDVGVESRHFYIFYR